MGEVHPDALSVKMAEEFTYLGSVIQINKDFDVNVIHRYAKWRPVNRDVIQVFPSS